MKEARFFGATLVENSLVFFILEKIREKHDIDGADPSKDPYKQRIL